MDYDGGRNYYSLDAFFSQEQRVKVRFNRTVPWHPLLQVEEQPSAMVMELDNIEKGSIQEMPIWLASEIARKDRLVSILPFRSYGTKMRADLDASPTAVNLAEHSKYYYMTGLELSKEIPTEQTARMLREAFRKRLPWISQPLLSPAAGITGVAEPIIDPHKAIFGGNSSSKAKMDSFERQLFDIAVCSRQEADKWHCSRKKAF